jgi:hypothetical protein
MPDIKLKAYYPPGSCYMMFSDMVGPIPQYMVLWGFLASLADEEAKRLGLPEHGMAANAVYVYEHDGQLRAITFRNGYAFGCMPEITGQLLVSPQIALQDQAN